MLRISKFFTFGGAAALAACLAIAGSPNFARAQDTGSWSSSTQSGEVAQPAKRAPLDLAGCWQGGVNDKKLGDGDGYLYIVQNNKKLTPDSMAYIEFPGTSIAGGGNVKGKTNSNRFHLGHHGQQCNASFHGTIDSSSGDLVGKYHLSKKCQKQVLSGTFDFPYDTTPGGCGGLE